MLKENGNRNQHPLAQNSKVCTSKFSVPHSSKNSRMGYAADPTVMYTINARFFTNPQA
jgi:hypothetical protein